MPEPASRRHTLSGGPPAPATSTRLQSALAEVPAFIKALDTGASAIVALVMARLLVPEQLSFLRGGVFVMAAFGVLASWIARRHVHRHAPKIVAIAVLCLVVLLVMDVVYVREVRYGVPVTAHQLLIGTSLNAFGDSAAQWTGRSPSEIIRGAGAVQIPELWNNYYPVAVAYVLTFVLFAFVSALAIGTVVERFALRRC